jgi:hypothetical protein
MRKKNVSQVLFLLIVWSLVLTGCDSQVPESFKPQATPTPQTQTVSTPVKPSSEIPLPEIGMNLYLYGQDQKIVGQSLAWLQDLGVGWVRLPLYWNEIEPQQGKRNWAEVDRAITTLNEAGIKIMLNAIHCPVWAAVDPKNPGLPRNPADFADFMREATARYKGKVVAYEIWNEPNLAREGGKPIKAGNYVELLKASYPVIKKTDPSVLVLTAGLTPTGVNNPDFAVDDVAYLDQFYKYNGGEAKKYFDVLGAHTGSSQNPPDTLWPNQPGPGPGWRDHPSFYFRRIEQIRQVMETHGDGAKKIWLTEMGWASTTNPAPGFGFAALVSENQQAQYLAQALKKSQADYKWLEKAFIFQLDMALPEFTPDPADERIAWGLIRRDGSKRPAYFAIQQFILGS